MSKPTPMSAHKAFHGKPFISHTPVAKPMDKIETKFPDTKFPPKAKAKPNANAPVGQGGRFQALENKLANKPGVTNPAGLTAFIGRKKYGKAGFAKLSAQGKKA